MLRVTDYLLWTVTVPALMIQSPEDRVVPPENGPYLLKKIGSTDKKLIQPGNSHYVAPALSCDLHKSWRLRALPV